MEPSDSFYINPTKISHPLLDGHINHLNFVLHCDDYLHSVSLGIGDYWLNEQDDPFFLSSCPQIPLFDDIGELRGKIKSYLESVARLKWVDDEGNETPGLNPNLSSEDVNLFLFGDCSGLTGKIHPKLTGDVSGLEGELSPDLFGRISPFLKGDITGLWGDLYALEGTLNKDLVGKVSGLRGVVNPLLKGALSNLSGHISPDLSGDCTGLKGFVSKLVGDCTGLEGKCSGLRGDCSGLVGDCSGLEGDCTGLSGDLSVVPWEMRPNLLENLSNFLSR